MERLEKYLCIAVAALLLMSGGYVLGRRSCRSNFPEIGGIVKTDTLRIRDTVFKDRPVPVEVKVVDTMPVPVTDTVTVNDTVYLSLPRETKLYGDTTYRAQVSGFRPSLDWIEVYPQTTVVTKNIFVDSRKRWGIGVQAGCGAYFDGGDVSLSPYVGIGISWNILTW